MTLSMILTHLALVVAALVFAILAGVPSSWAWPSTPCCPSCGTPTWA